MCRGVMLPLLKRYEPRSNHKSILSLSLFHLMLFSSVVPSNMISLHHRTFIRKSFFFSSISIHPYGKLKLSFQWSCYPSRYLSPSRTLSKNYSENQPLKNHYIPIISLYSFLQPRHTVVWNQRRSMIWAVWVQILL